MTTHTTTEPRYAVGDQVLIRGGHRTWWKIEAVLPATPTQPVGYRVRHPGGKTRTVDQDRLELAVEFLPPPEP
jgi:hypothetical protein